MASSTDEVQNTWLHRDTMCAMATSEAQRTPHEAIASQGSEEGPSTNQAAAAKQELPRTEAPPHGAASAGHAGPTRFVAGNMLGPYEVIRPIGSGGMSEVVLARDTRLGRKVALTFLREVDPQRSKRLLVEARTAAQLAHENIAALYDIATHEGLPYVVFEYVPGMALSALLKARREDSTPGVRAGMPEAHAAELMLPVARALACAHEAGMVHRALKPANIMIAESGTVKVRDFGIAELPRDAAEIQAQPTSGFAPLARGEDTAHRETDEDARARAGLDGTLDGTQQPAQTEALLETKAYMAPEQWNAASIDGRADLWAIGVILYEMVKGEHPLAPLSRYAVATVRQLDIPMPSAEASFPLLGPLIDRCLRKPVDERLGSARELCAALEEIARPHPGSPSGEGDEENPYAGLAAFEERDAVRFFGRETAALQIVLRLDEQPLLALVGASGAGKSSLMRAGVIPALKRGGAWEAFVIRPGPRPLATLAALLLEQAGQHSSPWEDTLGDRSEAPPPPRSNPASVLERLRQEPGLLGTQMRSRARGRKERVLLFVDQLEELYTLAREEDRAVFLACLAGAADDVSSPLRVVLAIRQDFLDRLAASAATFADPMSRGAVFVGPLEERGLERALVAPAEARGFRFESEALVKEMLGALAGSANALPLLQFTAAKLWEGRDEEKGRLTEASYRASGGVSGALSRHADSVIGALSASEQRAARRLFLRLVTPERTRAVVSLRDLLAPGGARASELPRVLSRLIEARLLAMADGGKEGNVVELVHASLITTWPTLARWLEEAQDDAALEGRLSAAAKAWEASGFAEGQLWRGDAAAEARRFQERWGSEAGPESRELRAQYLAAVVALPAREQRRRTYAVAALVTLLMLVVLVVSALAIRAIRAAPRADVEREEGLCARGSRLAAH
jgi:serine/threonine protein kinase